MSKRNCKVPECNSAVKSRGLCPKHYEKWRRGDESIVPDEPLHKPIEGKCQVEWCERDRRTKKYCEAHDRQVRFNGKILDRPIKAQVTGTIDYKLEYFTDKRGEDECWEWKGHKYGTGYGFIRVKDKNVSAHRYAFEVAAGRKLKPKEYVHHKCANRPCVNPNHLQSVSERENKAEMLQRNFYLSEIARLEALLDSHGIEH